MPQLHTWGCYFPGDKVVHKAVIGKDSGVIVTGCKANAVGLFRSGFVL